jgi:hypothetical protein
MNNFKNNSGYAVLELLFYISFFIVISLVVTNAMLVMARTFRESNIQAEFVQSGNIMERMSREIRAAYDINSGSANDLVINTKDQNGANKTEEFKLTNSNLQFFENSVLTGNLNPSNITVTSLNFSQITTAQSKAVKIILSVRSNDDSQNRVQNFYDTIVLRGSY